jgi:hypothetical protein
MWRPAYDYDLLPKLVFKIEADCLLSEVWAKAEETVEHQACLIVNIKYWCLRDTDCMPPQLKYIKYCKFIAKISRNPAG